jgi:hypothetical protein
MNTLHTDDDDLVAVNMVLYTIVASLLPSNNATTDADEAWAEFIKFAGAYYLLGDVDNEVLVRAPVPNNPGGWTCTFTSYGDPTTAEYDTAFLRTSPRVPMGPAGNMLQLMLVDATPAARQVGATVSS